MSEFTEAVYRTVRAVPRGRVVSYGGVAAILGRPRAARAVGTALWNLPDGSDVPWWRVINHNGEISIKGVLHGPRVQRALLEGEGVRFDRHGRVDWDRFGWSAEEPGARADDAFPGAGPPRPGARTRRSVALAIHGPGRARRLLLVRRPPDDPDLPDVWGLPAASLRPGESWEDAANRAARDKLGVDIALGPLRGRGTARRGRRRLEMRLFSARIRDSAGPSVPQPVDGVTQYTACRWGRRSDLVAGAERGSLCCLLELRAS
jgi:methylated-DNA-protein-cysteine methyltransferase-like protein